MNWRFLELTWNDFGFPPSIIKVIMSLTTSTSLSLKWNNEVLESFKSNRGLRQGDPLSLYLFLLCMEKLALMIHEKVTQKAWQPIKLTKDWLEISHLVFEDDCLLCTTAKSS